MDRKGRIKLPSEFRQALGWGTGTTLEVALTEKGAISIMERWLCCSLCDTDDEHLLIVGRGHVCRECEAAIRGEKREAPSCATVKVE